MSDSQEYIASVLAKHSWNLFLGNINPYTPITITYSFLTGRPDYYQGDYGDKWLQDRRGVLEGEANNFAALSDPQKSVFNQSMSAWSSVANITFSQAEAGQVGHITIANVKLQSDLAVTSSPAKVTALGVEGDIFINPNNPLNNGLNRGDVGYMTILHELGHALGLEHPAPYNTGDIGPFLSENANTKYSVMVKYNAKFGGWWTPSKPMLYDILAIQTLYGANPHTNADNDDSYTFKTGADAIQAIWDAGGIDDVIDAHEQTDGVTIDLRPGHFSFVGTNENTSKQQIAIAYQITGYENNWIENAIGGSGKNHLIGNNASNRLVGGASDDILEGGEGEDWLIGGAGMDTYIVEGYDHIIDSDGRGIVKDKNGNVIVGSFTKPAGSNAYVWTNNGNVTATKNSPLTLYLPDGSTVIIEDHVNNGDFGIYLVDASVPPTTPTTGLTVIGDLRPIDPLQYDSLGNIMVSGVANPGRNDTFYDSTENDLIQGLGGDDIIYASRGGDDKLEGGSGKDILYAGDGNDMVLGGSEDDNLQGEAGNDQLEGGTGRDALDGGVGNDLLFATDAIDITAALSGGEYGGATTNGTYGDFMQGGIGNDTLIGSAQSDAIMGGVGDDVILGGAGHDYIFADADYTPQNNNWTFGGLAVAYPSTDYADLGLGNGQGLSLVSGVLNSGVGGNDIIYGGSGGDYVLAGRGNDTIYGESGKDALDGGAGDDVLFGGDDDDGLTGDLNAAPETHGNDFLDLGSGSVHQSARGGGGDDTIIGGDTPDTIEGDELRSGYNASYHGDDTIDAKGGDDTVWGDGGSDVILGGAGNDYLEGDANGIDLQYQGNDYLDGGIGDDTLIGDGGDDILMGGEGADYLAGGAGDDIYLDVTDLDTVDDTEGNNTLILNQADSLALTSPFSTTNNGTTLLVTLSSGQTLTLQNALFGMNASLQFVNGQAIDLETTVGNLLTTSVNLQLDNTGGRLYGGAGWDYLYGGTGNDVLSGAMGNDSLSGGAGNDTLDGGAGRDTLTGGDGNDSLAGGQGSDSLDGGTGNDVYQFGLGDGFDTIIDSSGDNDVLRFGAGIVPNQVAMRHYIDINGHHNLTFEILDNYGNYSTDSITIQDFYTSPQASIDRIEFADGTVWTYSDIRQSLWEISASNGSFLQGTVTNDTLNGGTGADLLDGTAGDDVLQGNDGADILYGGIGHDRLEGGNGDDLLYGDRRYSAITGDGNDILVGGSGNDRLYGEKGNDTYLYNLGDGLDTVVDQPNTVGGSTDILRLGAGVLPEQVSLWRSDLNLIVIVNGNADQILIGNYFAATDYQIERFEFDNGMVWTAADINTKVQTGAANSQAGTAGNDNFWVDNSGDVITEAANGGIDTATVALLGSYTLPTNVENLLATGSLSGTLTGNAQDNVLTGNAGDNYFYGSTGNDTAYGGSGNDWYWYDIETVVEQAGEGDDTLVASGSAILPDNVENLTISSSTSGFTLTGNGLNNTLIGNSGFFYGSQQDVYDGGAGADIMLAQSNAAAIFYVDNIGDVVSARSSNDEVRSYIDYTIGNDIEKLTLLGSATYGHGNSLNNTLNGRQSATANVLSGGDGDDYYLLGEGDIAIEAASQGIDTVEFLSGLPVNYQLGANIEKVILMNGGTVTGSYGDDVFDVTSYGLLTLAGGLGNDSYYEGGTIIENPNEGYDRIYYRYSLGDWFIMPDNIEEASGQDGATNLHIRGNVLNNVIFGDSGDNWLDGGMGADTLRGGYGSDSYYVDQAGDVVTEEPGAGFDTVYSSIDYTMPDNVETLILQGSAVTATGNSAANQLVGNQNDNVLIGLGGNDTLTGNGGNDLLQGGEGSDVYQFMPNWGMALVEDSDNSSGGVDQLQLLYTMPYDVYVTQDEGHIYLALDQQNKITVAWNPTQGIGIEQVVFQDGTVWNTTGLLYAVTHHYPILQNAIPAQQAIENQAFSYSLPTNTFVELDAGESLSYSASLTDGSAIPAWLTFDAATQTLSGMPPSTATGMLSIQITATDTAGLSRSGNLDVFVYHLINGTTGNDTLTGTQANDAIYGLAGNDTLNGGSPDKDLLTGGLGNDTYIIEDDLDQIIELTGEGIDLVKSSITFDLNSYANLENLTLTGINAIDGYGNASDNVLTGNNAANRLEGRQGNDTYVVGNGDTVVEYGNEGVDTIQTNVGWTLATELENLILTGTTAVNGSGNAGNNVMTGNSATNILWGYEGDDILNGGSGIDTLIGGAGNDTYVVDNTLDVVTESLNEGTDSVQSSVTYVLGANIESLTLTGSTAINGTGNSLDNVLTGNSAANTLVGGVGNDRLVGGAGTDTMQGGVGNDTYVVDVSTDIVTENTNEGTDTVETGITYTLGTNVENLTLTGTTAINGTGNTLNNILTGNSAANILSGGTGADTMLGAAGNDTYVVDNTLDVVTENLNEGTDLVQASVTYTLSTNVDNLTLTGTSAINGTGNTLDNVLTGNSGANTLVGDAGNDRLVGGAGIDTMLGGVGNDTFVVDVATDIVMENLNEGTDTVETGITYTLGANLENLTLTGTTAVNGTGNTLDNVLTGNSVANTLAGGTGNDRLVGGAGTDTMLGGAGNDTFVVDVATDIVMENLNEGTDTVETGITYTLGTNVENLTLTGNAAINGNGNTLNNVLIGNSAINSLTGAAGNDTLDGIGGADTLTGGTGNDTYILGRGYGADTVVENDATAGNSDIAQFLSGVATDQIWFQHVSNNLEASIIGTLDKLVLKDWYLGTANHVEQFKTTDGAKTLIDSNVQNLVNAMASFAPPAAGQSTLPQNYQTALAPVIAANWQ